MNFYKIKVDKIIKETEDAVSLGFTIPSDHPLHQFVPGQYLTLKYYLKGEQFLRCYSISSVPNDTYLQITVKKTKHGFISREIVNKTKIGDEFEFGDPHGKFKIPDNKNSRRTHCFFAAGSGITPIFSMIKFLLEEEPMSNVVLLYSNKKESDIIFYHELIQIEEKYSGQIKIFFTLTGKRKSSLFSFLRPPLPKWKGWQGRIETSMIQKLLEEIKGFNKDKEFYLCGPGNFIQRIEQHLLHLQIDFHNIHKEYFNIKTEKNETEVMQESNYVSSHLKFKLNGKVAETKTHKGELILDALIRSGYQPPYSCSSGACASCIAKLQLGEVKMDSDLALEKSEIEEGYILTCQARCTSDHVEIEYLE